MQKLHKDLKHFSHQNRSVVNCILRELSKVPLYLTLSFQVCIMQLVADQGALKSSQSHTGDNSWSVSTDPSPSLCSTSHEMLEGWELQTGLLPRSQMTYLLTLIPIFRMFVMWTDGALFPSAVVGRECKLLQSDQDGSLLAGLCISVPSDSCRAKGHLLQLPDLRWQPL